MAPHCYPRLPMSRFRLKGPWKYRLRRWGVLFDAYKLTVAVGLASFGLMFQFAPPDINATITPGINAAIHGVSAAVLLTLQLLPPGGDNALRVPARIVTSSGIALLTMLAGYNWLDHETNGNVQPYLLIPLLCLVTPIVVFALAFVRFQLPAFVRRQWAKLSRR